MVIKVKEITIGRSRKWAWDFGNAVGYTVSATMEGTTAKDSKEDMREAAIAVLSYLEDIEHERCRDVFNIAKFQEDQAYKGMLTGEQQISKEISEGEKPLTTSSGHPVEKLVVTEEVLMDPNEVTIMAKTDLSLLVTKKGFQKWIPFSLMPDISKDDYNKGEYIEKIVIKEDKRKWFNEVKGWDKLEVRKS